MPAETVQVRVRWLDGRIETLDPMPKEPGVEEQEIRGLGNDLRWYPFRYSGEVDTDGSLIFVQGAKPVVDSPAVSTEVVELSVQCYKCGKRFDISCETHGFGEMKFYPVECPYCLESSQLPLPAPGNIVETFKAGS
jgi:hypothetical protein